LLQYDGHISDINHTNQHSVFADSFKMKWSAELKLHGVVACINQTATEIVQMLSLLLNAGILQWGLHTTRNHTRSPESKPRAINASHSNNSTLNSGDSYIEWAQGNPIFPVVADLDNVLNLHSVYVRNCSGYSDAKVHSKPQSEVLQEGVSTGVTLAESMVSTVSHMQTACLLPGQSVCLLNICLLKIQHGSRFCIVGFQAMHFYCPLCLIYWHELTFCAGEHCCRICGSCNTCAAFEPIESPRKVRN
jgi:hypothetical protein